MLILNLKFIPSYFKCGYLIPSFNNILQKVESVQLELQMFVIARVEQFVSQIGIGMNSETVLVWYNIELETKFSCT